MINPAVDMAIRFACLTNPQHRHEPLVTSTNRDWWQKLASIILTNLNLARILVRLLNEQFDDIEQDTTNCDQANDHNKDITVFAGILL